MNRKHLFTIHDDKLGDVRVEKVDDALVFIFEKAPGWMFAAPADVQHPEHPVRFGFCYNNQIANEI